MKQNTHLKRQLLVSVGLAEKEALIYDLLLTHGEMAAARIEQLSKQKKNTYTLLKRLQNLGLVLKKSKDGKQYYSPAAPERLRELVVKQKEAINKTAGVLDEYLPQLQSDYRMAVDKPVVRYFEGPMGLKAILDDIYAPKEDVVYGAVEPDKLEALRQGLTKEELVPSRKASGLKVKAFFTDTPLAKWLHEHDGEHLRESILVDGKKYPMPGQIEVYGNTIALLSFKRGEFVGMLIEHDELAQTLKSVMRYVFDREKDV